MLVTLDSQLQVERRKNLEDLAKYYGGGQQVEIEETRQVIAPGVSYARPIPTRRVGR